MNSKLKKYICTVLVCCLFITFNTPSFAQNNNTQTAETSLPNGPRKQMSMIFLAGLGGAVLGLSTLSFYGRPQDHMSNIAYGFAFGVIIGTVFTTVNTVKKPKEYLNSSTLDDIKIYEPLVTSRGYLEARNLDPKLLSYTFQF